MRRRPPAPFAFLLVLLLGAWRWPLVTHAKVLLLLTEQLPQSPLKPLRWLTAGPSHARPRLNTAHGAVVADLFLPARRFGLLPERGRPAVVLAFGMALHAHDRPVLLRLARTLARLGYAVLWPRLEALEAGAPLAEQPDTFVAGVRYLAGLPTVDRERVSLFGFSVGASTALVAASDARVAAAVRAVIFFGGYHDLSAYLVSVASRSMVVADRLTEWQPTDEVPHRIRPMLEAQAAHGVLSIFAAASRAGAEARLRAAPPAGLAALSRLDPRAHLEGLRARVFILHDRGDSFVPYVEALKLRRALPEERVGAFLLTDLFAHAQPKAGLSWRATRDIASLHRFASAAFGYL